jgi:hypothetical protein
MDKNSFWLLSTRCRTGAACRGASIVIVAGVGLIGLAASAVAGGSVSLAEVLELTKNSPQVRDMVDQSLRSVSARTRTRMRTGDVECTATRVGRHLEKTSNLKAGMRVPPFDCPIGGRTLRIVPDETSGRARNRARNGQVQYRARWKQNDE